MLIPPSVKRAYEGVALFALLNMLVLGGLGAYLIGGGTMDSQKLRTIAAVLRGEKFIRPSDVEAEPSTETADAATPETPETVVADSQPSLEVYRREAERIKEELRQRLALNNSILLRIATEQETFRRQREVAARQAEAARAVRETAGYEKQIAIMEGLKPKTAVEHLLGISDTDEAARILLAMETRKAKQIVEAAKTREQTDRMKVILRRLSEVSPDGSAKLAPER